MPQRGHTAGPGAGGAGTAATGAAAGLAGICAAAAEGRGAAAGAESKGFGAEDVPPPGRQAVGAEASFDAAAASCGEVTARGRGASCAGSGVDAIGPGVKAAGVPAGLPAPGATGLGEAGGTRWIPAAPPGRTTCGAEPAAAIGRSTGAAAGLPAEACADAMTPEAAEEGGPPASWVAASGVGEKALAAPTLAGSGAAGDALGGSAGAGAGAAVCSFWPQPRQYLNWSWFSLPQREQMITSYPPRSS